MFQLEHYETLSKACYNCPNNVTDCYRPHCIAADGVRRTILTVNRMMPGPKIEVYTMRFFEKLLILFLSFVFRFVWETLCLSML